MRNVFFPTKLPPDRLLPSLPVFIQYYGLEQRAKVMAFRRGEETIFKQYFSGETSDLSQQDYAEILGKKYPNGEQVALPSGEFLLPQGARRVDAYALREAFFNIKTIEEATDFLECCGPFRTDVHGTSMNYIAGWQDAFRGWWLYGYGCFPLPPVIELGAIENERIGGMLSWHIATLSNSGERADAKVEAWIHCDSAVEAIAATIALDLITGSNFRGCQWCSQVFEVIKENGRMFCSPACAHRAGQKRRRADAKKKQALASSSVKVQRTSKGKR